MVNAIDKRLRHKNEILFFDEEAENILSTKNSFKLTNTKTHVEIFNEIPQLKAIVPFFGNVKDKKLLDLGCGDGWASLYFARSGAHVVCCDISPKCLQLAKKLAESNGLADRISTLVMAAEELSLKSRHFDFVFVNASLHHFDLSCAISEIKRILKRDGKAAFIEDLAYHPILRIYRALTPHRHTVHEKPLRKKELDLIYAEFERVRIEYTGVLNVQCKNGKIWGKAQKIDHMLLRIFPAISKYARIVSICVQNPKQ